ncbi:MAG TPA: HAMP domain-containing sensor histidine kinase [Gaiellaceae bacterium]|nr:HAMP domain-containing sensor histidine kinase [Gaiellaceae bacterium]
MRSPVAALSAIAGTLVEGELDAEARRELVRLSALACRAIERIVADAAVTSIHREPVDPVVLVGDVVTAARLRGAQIAFVAQQAPLVDADPARLRQALDNLITNAVVHGGPRVEISIAVRADDALTIDVSDNGPGIEEDELQRIFDTGYRLDPERPGTGIGLALARSIAEGHGGALTVESRLGHGTVFTVSLPLHGC